MSYMISIGCAMLFSILSLLILRSTAEYGIVKSENEAEVPVGEQEENTERQDDTPPEIREKERITPREYGLYFAFVCLTCVAVSVFLLWFYQQDLSYVVLTSAIISVLWACSWYDRKYHLIPNRILVFALILRAAIFAVQMAHNPGDMIYILMSSGIAAFALILASILCRLLSPGSVGAGDVKLLGVMGLYLGVNHVWSPVFVTLIVLFCTGVYLLVFKKADRKSEIPLAPFLLIGTVIAAFLTGA